MDLYPFPDQLTAYLETFYLTFKLLETLRPREANMVHST